MIGESKLRPTKLSIPIAVPTSKLEWGANRGFFILNYKRNSCLD